MMWWALSDEEIAMAGQDFMSWLRIRRNFITAAADWFDQNPEACDPEDEMRAIGEAVMAELVERRNARRADRDGDAGKA